MKLENRVNEACEQCALIHVSVLSHFHQQVLLPAQGASERCKISLTWCHMFCNPTLL